MRESYQLLPVSGLLLTALVGLTLFAGDVQAETPAQTLEQVTGQASGVYGKAKEAFGQLSMTVGSMFVSFSKYYGQIANLISDVCLLLAIVFGISGLFKLKGHQTDPQQNPIGHTVALLAVAGGLANVGLMATVGGNTIYGDGYTFISYSSIEGGNEISERGIAMVRGLVGFIQLLGLFAFVRGWLMLRNTAKPGGQAADQSTSRALVFLVGGVLALNLVSTVTLIANSVGAGAVSAAIFGG